MSEIDHLFEQAAAMRERFARGDAAKLAAFVDSVAVQSVRAGADLAIDPLALNATVALASPDAAQPARPAASSRRVAVVAIDGPLAPRAQFGMCAFVDGYDFIAARLQRALASDDVDAVVLRIDSPGGAVAGLEDGTARMRALRDQAGKPVLVHADCAASAAYWIAAGVASDGGLFVSKGGRAGCIGVMGQLTDESKSNEMKGVAIHVIAEPAGKAEGHPANPTSDEAKKRARARIGELAARFFDHVAESRGLTAKAVRALDGETFLDDAARERGLVDGVQSFEATVALAAEKGRTARLEQEKRSMEKAEQERLQAFEKSALETTAAKSAVEALGKIDGYKAKAEQYDGLKAKYDTLVAKVETESKERAEGELVAIVDKAVADGLIEPSAKAGFLEKARKHGGKDFAEAALEGRKPVLANPGEKGGPKAIVPANAPKVVGDLAALGARVGLTDEDFAAAKAAGAV